MNEMENNQIYQFQAGYILNPYQVIEHEQGIQRRNCN